MMERILLIFLILLLAPACLAQDEGRADDSAPGQIEEPQDQEQNSDGILDRHKKLVDTQIQRAAQWVDSFFSDPNFEAESANTLVRLRPELYYRNEQGTEGRFKARIKLRLPNMNRKTSLVIGSDDAVDSFGDTADDSAEDAVIGLQFFGRETRRWHTSLSLGIKFDEFAAYVGPRVRYMRPWGEQKSISFTQALRYQSNNYWNSISRLDFNFILGDRYFFRQTFDGRWRGEKSDQEGFRTRIASVFTQRLQNGAGLQYDFSTIIHTRPDTRVDSYTLALRYRKRTRREWLYYEIVPQVSFDHEFDYTFNPGIRLRVEFFYGADTSAEFWKREHEDDDQFRW